MLLTFRGSRYTEVGGFQVGSLEYDSDYNYFRDETDRDLNPCAVFYTAEDRTRRNPFYRTVPAAVVFKDGKMHVGSLYTYSNHRVFGVARYNPATLPEIQTPPQLVTTKPLELEGWDRWLAYDGLAMIHELEEDYIGDGDPCPIVLNSGASCLIVRGWIVKLMLRHLPDFHLKRSLAKPETIFVVQSHGGDVKEEDLADGTFYSCLLFPNLGPSDTLL